MFSVNEKNDYVTQTINIEFEIVENFSIDKIKFIN